MGEAKIRGTFEQRKAKAIKRNEAKFAEKVQRNIERERNLTPEEKDRRFHAQRAYAWLFGMMNYNSGIRNVWGE